MSISGIGAGFGFGYVGANYATVAADDARAKSSGLNGAFSLADILTPEDKAVTGYNPDSAGANGAARINEAAIAVARDRYTGTLQGNITADYLNGITQRTNLSPALIQQMMANLAEYNKANDKQALPRSDSPIDFTV